jgi:hypothetical protein
MTLRSVGVVFLGAGVVNVRTEMMEDRDGNSTTLLLFTPSAQNERECGSAVEDDLVLLIPLPASTPSIQNRRVHRINTIAAVIAAGYRCNAK